MNKELWLIWKNPKKESRRRYKVGKLTKNDKGYMFVYSDDIELAIREGFDLYPGFSIVGQKYESETLFPNILSRIPDKKRKDYLDIINVYNLSPNASPLQILEATKGRLPTDNFEFVPAITQDTNRLEFNIAGTRYQEDSLVDCADKLKPNTKLKLISNPNNNYDKNAVEIYYEDAKNDYLIGYVPRYYAGFLADRLRKGLNYSALVKRVVNNSPNNDDRYTVEVKIIIE